MPGNRERAAHYGLWHHWVDAGSRLRWRGEPYDGPLIYGGVYYDWVELIPGLFRSGDSMSGILMILDLPLSFIADTIMLPLTVTDHLLAKDAVPSEGPTHPAVPVGGGRTADETPAVEPMLTEPRRLPPEP